MALRYVLDDSPGITRRSGRAGFSYISPEGRAVRDPRVLARIRALAIPPAWTNVWICPIPNGHLQATGRDARGRKQYRYHTQWRRVRDETKFSRLTSFARALPRLRRRVQADLNRQGLPREKVLAVIVRLLESTLIRVGNEEYARDNGSYGLTTMRDRHVRVDGARVELRFRGKSGKAHAIPVNDRRLARLVKRCRDLPGQQLFQYQDDSGVARPVDSGDVNDYLRDVSGDAFTAKDFRTWGGTLLAASLLSRTDAERRTKAALVDAIKSVAHQLGNTAAICRKCYVHPAVMDAFVDARAFARFQSASTRTDGVRGLGEDERTLMRFLESAERVRKAA